MSKFFCGLFLGILVANGTKKIAVSFVDKISEKCAKYYDDNIEMDDDVIDLCHDYADVREKVENIKNRNSEK